MPSTIRIAPSILSADFARLGEEVTAIERAGADYIHIDVMDGHFVPNLTIGPSVIRAVRPCTKLPFDVHLMIEPVEPYISAYAEAGADIITIHAEAAVHLHRAVHQIKALGKKAGISIVPSTPPAAIEALLPEIDLVLVMSVNPGFGGQSFIPSSLDKIRAFRRMMDSIGRAMDLEVDGGITIANARDVIAAGANVLVAGSAVFSGGADSYQENIRKLRG